MKKIVEIAGWLGTTLILGAFAANVFAIWSNESLLYLSANALGAALVGWNVFVKKSWPALALEIVWFFVAIFGIVKFFA
ncbi:MAG: hypothetical protein WCV72_01085 [Patescibacteria group bacterium]